MRIALIAKPGHADTGVGRYVNELESALLALGHDVVRGNPSMPFPAWFMQGIKRLTGWDLAAFFNHYPVRAVYPEADIYHLTSQNLATLMLFHRPPGKTVITVHDMIPWDTRKDPELRVYRHRIEEFFDWLGLKGLKRADGIITDSSYSAGRLATIANRRPEQSATGSLGIQ